jgi:hypothetical protein
MKRIFLVVLWIFAATMVCSAQATIYFPHIANGVLGSTIWKTTILLTNPAAAGAASGTITFNQDNPTDQGLAGSPFNISFTDEVGTPTVGTITFSISPGQTKKYVSAGTGAYSPGFATATTSAGSVTGTAIFSEFDIGTGRLIAEAGVPAANALTKQAVFVDTIGGYNIAVAYANPGPAAATVTFNLLNSTAVSVATTNQQLGPGNHVAAFTSGIFPSVGPLAGTMQITSSVPVPTIALRFDPVFTIFTTLPQLTIASIVSPAMEWFHERPWLAPLSSVARLLGALDRRLI